MDDDVRLLGHPAESAGDEIHLALNRREVVLRTALQDERLAELGQVGNLRDVEPDVLGQDVAQPGHDLARRPALPLEIDDVRLHEHRAAVAEARHRLGAEGDVRELLNLETKGLCRALQEVAVARRALRVELEVLDLPVLEDDELDVLPADVDDHVGLGVKVHARLRVRDRLDEGDVGVQHVFEDVFGIAGRADAEHVQLAALIFDLLLQKGEDFHRVFDGVALGELIGFADDVLLHVEQDALGARTAAVETDECLHGSAGRV